MTRSLSRFTSILVALLVLALGETGARAADTAESFIQARQADVTSLLHEKAGGARDRKISAVLEKMIDFDELARRSLGNHWGELSDVQQKEFSSVLKQLVQRNYERNIKSILDYKVEYLGQEPESDPNVVVHTRASSKTNQREEPITIDYRMAPAGDSWRVIDIVTEGSSLVSNYKNQFHRIITKDGYDALLRKMKDKLAKGQNV
jgi:phospholipid transport system substrate-binding protein